MGERQHWLIFALLSPLFAVQALYLKRTVPRLPEPKCPRTGVSGQGRPLKILILGDSAGAGVGAALQAEALTGNLVGSLQDSFEIHWTIHATTGWTTRDCLDNLDLLEAQPIDAIVTSLGINDLTGMVPLETWIRQQECLVWRCRERFGNPTFFLSGLPPIGYFPALPQPLRWWLGSRAQLFSSTLEGWCATRTDCHYVKLASGFTPDMMASDGFHPGPPIYNIWAGWVAEAFRAHYLRAG